MSLSEPFIRRPIGTSLLMLGVLVFGIGAYNLLPVAALPKVDFPTIAVQVNYPGASPDVMSSSVTAPLERQFGQVPGLKQMTSTSSFGCSVITLQFSLDLSIDIAEQEVQAAINAGGTFLPRDLPNPPIYNKVNPADAPILILALTSDTLSRGDLYDSASTVLAQKLSQVDGIGEVTVGGSSLPAVRVEINPRALAKYGIGLEDVRAALAAANAHSPKGAIDVGKERYQIYSNDQATAAAQYRSLVIAYRNEAAVRLSDVAEVVDSVENLRNAGLANGKPSVLVILNRAPGANIIETVDRIIGLLPDLRASVSPAIDITVAVDRSTTIRASLQEVERTLLIAIALVILVVFVFLRNPRAALVPAVAVCEDGTKTL